MRSGMKTKCVFSTALILAVLSAGAVRAQAPSALRPMDTVPPPAGNGDKLEGATQPQPGPISQRSSWIRGDKYDCGSCCFGNNGPIGGELFFRAGPAFS